jgi:glycosyltransferase involved in cell wall biosynthesis
LVDHYRIGEQPIAVVPHGPYDHGVPPTRSRETRQPGAPINLLSFGTIRPYKGVDDVVAAFNSMTPEQVNGFTLTVVGETWEGWNKPEQLIRASPYRERIEFVNHYVTDAEASEYFEAADAVVLPYLRSSASGPLQMAMSHGLPVVVTAVGGLTEAAGTYEGARFVPPGDVDALRGALIELGEADLARYADPHSWETTATQLATLFSDCSDPTRPGAISPGVSERGGAAEPSPVEGIR